MTTFSCLFNAPGSLRSLRSQRPPRTTVARGASHVTHGVTESRKITGYSLSILCLTEIEYSGGSNSHGIGSSNKGSCSSSGNGGGKVVEVLIVGWL